MRLNVGILPRGGRDWIGQAIRFRRPVSLECLTQSLKLSTLFRVGTSLGSAFSCKWIGWIPDFQHRHIPQLCWRPHASDDEDAIRLDIRRRSPHADAAFDAVFLLHISST